MIYRPDDLDFYRFINVRPPKSGSCSPLAIFGVTLLAVCFMTIGTVPQVTKRSSYKDE